MKLLIIGSEGFIGNTLVQLFQKKDMSIVGCDLFEVPRFNYPYVKVSRLSPEWEDIFATHQFDACVNASGSGNVPYSMQHPLFDFEANTLDPIRILDTIRRHNKSCKYLHISSAAVYGNPDKLPIHENDAKHPLSPYGWHKLMSELICNEYHTVYDVPTAIVRPFSVFGAGLKKQLLWDICVRLKDNDVIQLFGTGNESRDFIHCSDLAVLMDLLIRNAPFNGEVYNAASGREVTIGQVADVIEQFHGGKKRITFSGQVREGDPKNWCADIKSIASLGFAPEKNFNDSIHEYIKWFQSLS